MAVLMPVNSRILSGKPAAEQPFPMRVREWEDYRIVGVMELTRRQRGDG